MTLMIIRKSIHLEKTLSPFYFLKDRGSRNLYCSVKNYAQIQKFVGDMINSQPLLCFAKGDMLRVRRWFDAPASIIIEAISLRNRR